MSNDDYQAVLDGFIADLNTAMDAVGSPSYARLEQLSEQVHGDRPRDIELVVLARSTTQEILAGRRRQPPRWQWVLSFVTTLQVAARKAGVDVSRIGTIEDWKRRHDAVRAAGERACLRAGGIGARRRERPGHAYVGSGASLADVRPASRTGALTYAESEEDALSAEVLGMLRQAGAPHWWDCYRDVAPDWLEFYLYLESAAEGIRTYETEIIPGLLQVEAYARAVMRQCLPRATADDIDRLVELRMRRQQQHRDSQQSRMLWAILEEAALRNERISPRIMRAQVRHLIQVAEQHNIAIQIVPAGTTGNGTISEPVTIFRFPGKYLCDVVHLEQPGHGYFLHERKIAEHYNWHFNSLSIMGISPKATRKFLWELFREILGLVAGRSAWIRTISRSTRRQAISSSPGIAPIQEWRPDEQSAGLPGDINAWGGVALKR